MVHHLVEYFLPNSPEKVLDLIAESTESYDWGTAILSGGRKRKTLHWSLIEGQQVDIWCKAAAFEVPFRRTLVHLRAEVTPELPGTRLRVRFATAWYLNSVFYGITAVFLAVLSLVSVLEGSFAVITVMVLMWLALVLNRRFWQGLAQQERDFLEQYLNDLLERAGSSGNP